MISTESTVLVRWGYSFVAVEVQLMIQGTRESKILGGSGSFVRFSYFMYVTCCRLALFETFIPCFRWF